ncbi:MAG: ABC transporter permease [Candidatus Thermoplasmatota archaeon]
MGVLRVIRHSAWICWKDLTEFSRSKLRLVMLVLMPLFMMVMVGFIFPSGSSISDQPVAISLQDIEQTVAIPPTNVPVTYSFGSVFVAQLMAVNNQTGMMTLSTSPGFEDIKAKVENGELSGGIIISENFTSDILSGKQGMITVITDQSNPQMSAMMQSVLSKTIEMMGTQTAMSNLNKSYSIPFNATLAIIQPYTVKFQGIVPGEPNYFQFVAPGIIGMTVMMSLMTGLPHAISYEKDIGTLDGMLVAPINRLSIIMGKVMAQTVRGLIQAAIILILAVLLFGVVIQGNILLVVGVMLLSVFSFVGLGILITSFTEREETATMVMMTLMFPMMFLSGVFFPIQQMPWYMQDVAYALPLTYATTALRKVMVLGAGLPSIYVEVSVLFGFGTVFLALAVPMFKKAMSR